MIETAYAYATVVSMSPLPLIVPRWECSHRILFANDYHLVLH